MGSQKVSFVGITVDQTIWAPECGYAIHIFSFEAFRHFPEWIISCVQVIEFNAPIIIIKFSYFFINGIWEFIFNFSNLVIVRPLQQLPQFMSDTNQGFDIWG